uniref:Uncharacterized protein n=1 Tax=Zea mays TaxID=4577 RepID=B6SID1_MAIZE|nr:hypothetical protein [Zea mays]|eukprot:NP_001142519.1 uncharacterized protein LOC100274755 [Zea mays]
MLRPRCAPTLPTPSASAPDLGRRQSPAPSHGRFQPSPMADPNSSHGRRSLPAPVFSMAAASPNHTTSALLPLFQWRAPPALLLTLPLCHFPFLRQAPAPPHANLPFL